MVIFKPSILTRKLKTRPLRNKSQEWGESEERVKNCGGYSSAACLQRGVGAGCGHGAAVGLAQNPVMLRAGVRRQGPGTGTGPGGLVEESQLLCPTFFDPKATMWIYCQLHIPWELEPRDILALE